LMETANLSGFSVVGQPGNGPHERKSPHRTSDLPPLRFRAISHRTCEIGADSVQVVVERAYIDFADGRTHDRTI
jgi:hypothetical protein